MAPPLQRICRVMRAEARLRLLNEMSVLEDSNVSPEG
jgi:hypothetical protein